MSLHGLLDAVVKDAALAEAVKAATDGNRMHVDLVGPPAARPFAVAALARDASRPVLAVTATGREAEDLAAALRSLLPPDAVGEYPSWETRPHERRRLTLERVGAEQSQHARAPLHQPQLRVHDPRRILPRA